MKNTKKLLTIALAVLLICSAGAVSVSAKCTAKTQNTTCTTTVKKQTTTKKAKKSKKLKKSAAKASKVCRSGKMITINYKKVINVKAPAVTVKDADGNAYSARFVKVTRKSLKIKVSGLKRGKTYTVTVTGVKLASEESYGFITANYKYGK